MKKSLLLPVVAAVFCLQQYAGAQNASPYWSLAGNSNATTSSKLGTTNAIPLRLFTNNATRVYINTSGNVGIGNSSPAQKLHVSGNTYISGNLGVGVTSPAYKLHVNGNASIANGLVVGNNGVYGYNSAGPGVYGSGSNYGVYATSPGYGVYATSSAGSVGVYATSSYAGVYGEGGSYGLWGYSSGGWGVLGQSSSNIGVYGSSGSNYGVYGGSTSYPAIYGYSNNHYGSESHSNTTWAATAYGVNGVYGQGTTGTGVYGRSTSGLGGYFYSASSYGVRAGTGRSDKNWAGVFDGNVYTFGAYQTSDKNLKKNIEDFSDAISIINKLKPRSYEFRSDAKLASMNLPTGKHYGLIAQDLELVLPNLVREVDADISDHSKTHIGPKPTDGKAATTPFNQTKQQIVADQNSVMETMMIKSVNYTELIPILVKAVQEQQQEIEILKEQVKSLSKGNNSITALSNATLGQASPNPVKSIARIKYEVPENAVNAKLLLSDALGRTLKVIPLSRSGVLDLDATSLSSGVYNYSLIVDNQTVSTKKMTVAR